MDEWFLICGRRGIAWGCVRIAVAPQVWTGGSPFPPNTFVSGARAVASWAAQNRGSKWGTGGHTGLRRSSVLILFLLSVGIKPVQVIDWNPLAHTGADLI